MSDTLALVITLGIDLSADIAKTSVCRIDWASTTVALLPRPIDDATLVDAIAAADRTAIDVPLGWPDPFVEALVAHHSHAGWPPLTLPVPEDRLGLRFRTTDLDIRAEGAQPLSVSTDRIGVAAMRGARLQCMLAGAGIAVDRAGLTGRVVEAYPAAALRVWGLGHTGYKGSKNSVARSALTASLVARCAPFSAALARCLDGCDDDDLDAVVCSITARAAALGLTTTPRPDQLDAARREGWIHNPTADLETVITADRAI